MRKRRKSTTTMVNAATGTEDHVVEMEEERMEMNFSNDTTTIDPNGVKSRILVSSSLQQQLDDDDQPHFQKLSAVQASGNRVEYRRVRCPPHRYTPLREHWEQILTPLVEYLKLQVRNLLFTAMLIAVHPTQTTVERRQATATVRGMNINQYTESIVLFLEIQTLREASILADEMGRFHIAV
jgi:hypothetical protein